MSTTINETCGCGATFNVTTQYGDVARNAATRWREEHKHAESVGICGDRLGRGMSETSEVLRRAAGLMRERAEAAVEFRDAHTRAPLLWHGNAGAVYDAGAAPIAATADGAKSLHIASWHPAVALAVADWLDLEVLIASDPKNHAEISREALAVARAYLGADQ